MEMCYDGALVMPSSYVVMDEEEMTYVEGGDAKKLKNNLVGLWNRTQGIRIAFKAVGIQLATIKAAAQYTFAAAVTKFGPVVLKIAAVLPKVICAALIVGAKALCICKMFEVESGILVCKLYVGSAVLLQN